MIRTAAPPRSRPVSTFGPLLLVALLSWAAAVAWMGGMPSGPGADPGPLGAFTAVWVVMMAAMMLPSVWPTVLVYQRLQAARRERGEPGVTAGPALLLLGYFAAWTLAGIVGFAVVKAGRALDVEALRWDRGGPLVAGAVLAGAAVYQLTPLKDVCLRHCRGPFGFLLEHWRPGPSGAVRMGARHGLWCIGCCWALMAALFALGVMSIPWMVLITLLIAAEKLLPWRRVAMTAVTAVLLALGIAVAVAPERVPWLTPAGASMPGMPMPSMPGMPMPEMPMPGANVPETPSGEGSAPRAPAVEMPMPGTTAPGTPMPDMVTRDRDSRPPPDS